jgi:hypothetical protein
MGTDRDLLTFLHYQNEGLTKAIWIGRLAKGKAEALIRQGVNGYGASERHGK